MTSETVTGRKQKRDKRASARLSALTLPDKTVSMSFHGVDGFYQPRRCTVLKIGWFPKDLRLVSDQIHPTHFNFIYDPMT